MNFEDLKMMTPLLETVRRQGYEAPTPIQEMAIPFVLDGRDVLGCAQTGTGKTAAFALPILQRLSKAPQHKGRRPLRALILAPTRELALQIEESFHAYSTGLDLKICAVYGGVKQKPQTQALSGGVDICVATPGRLLDLMGQGFVKLQNIETFVLDEADRLLDMGFINDIRKIVKALPKKRQTLFFSATLAPEIRSFAGDILIDPETVYAAPVGQTVEGVEQAVFFVEQNHKISLLIHLLQQRDIDNALVFTRTKHGADRLVKQLSQASIRALAIHGDKTQIKRRQALDSLKRGKLRVLVATDLASRGLDIEHLSHVINFDLPNEPEAYVHRIGRTGRAGLSGIAWSFCGMEERPFLKSIEKLTHKSLEIETEHPFRSPLPDTFGLKPKFPLRSGRGSAGRRSRSHSFR